MVFIRGDQATAIYLNADTRIQILDTMMDLPGADKEQCGAFIVCHTAVRSITYLPTL